MADIWNSYGPTAARRHDETGRVHRPASPTLDIHAHVAIPAAAQIAQPHLDPGTIPLARWQAPETRAVNAKQDGDLKTRITSFEDRLRALDAMGVESSAATISARLGEALRARSAAAAIWMPERQ